MIKAISMIAFMLLSGLATNVLLASNDAQQLRPFVTEDPDQTIHYQPPTAQPNQPGSIPTNTPPVQQYIVVPNNQPVIITTPDDIDDSTD